jgi:hypothetical protein
MELVKVENGEIVVAQEIINQIVEFEKEKLKMDLIQKELKEKLKEAMENKITFYKIKPNTDRWFMN